MSSNEVIFMLFGHRIGLIKILSPVTKVRISCSYLLQDDSDVGGDE